MQWVRLKIEALHNNNLKCPFLFLIQIPVLDHLHHIDCLFWFNCVKIPSKLHSLWVSNLPVFSQHISILYRTKRIYLNSFRDVLQLQAVLFLVFQLLVYIALFPLIL